MDWADVGGWLGARSSPSARRSRRPACTHLPCASPQVDPDMQERVLAKWAAHNKELKGKPEQHHG